MSHTDLNQRRGPRKIAIYNAAFVPLAGETHPRLMGIGFIDAFPEIWEDIRPVFELSESTRMAVDVNEMPLMVLRNNFLEETVFHGNFIPIRGDTGHIGGFYNAVWEKTKDVIRQRRTVMLNKISSSSEECDTSNVIQYIMRQLESDPKDIPMAMFYRIVDNSEPDQLFLRLVGSIGLPENHTYAITADIESEQFPMSLLREAKSRTTETDRGASFENISWRGFNEPSNIISTIPLRNGGQLFGFLIIGTNPRRPTDSDHHQLTADLARHVSSAIASVVGIEEANKRQKRLEKDLAFTERQLRYLSEHASVAMSSFDADGGLLWANDHYYDIMGYEKSEENNSRSFMEYIHPDSHEETARLFAGLAVEDQHVSLEIKLNRLYTPPVGPPEPAHALAWGFPYFEDNQPKTLMSVMTDVSRLKWQEKWQARAAEEAREAKRNQDQFIDCISHEIRNPLSAIFQLADAISNSIVELERNEQTMDSAKTLLAENVEAAKTIILCAEHQKRIVDDVLTISKLDFMLLSLKPIAASPSKMVRGVVKMFEADASYYGINLEVKEDPLLSVHNADWILCDPSRLSQIFINLITNAIKFTKAEKSQRKITLTYGACLSDPCSHFSPKIVWAPKQDVATNINLEPDDWGSGEVLYLVFSITDTGAGMKKTEIHNIFSRFSQASAKTFVKYGGSGLGLYISQRLLEKQGGDIGVMSVPGGGSTFAFYIKCYRAEPPNGKQSINRADALSGRYRNSHTVTALRTPIITSATTTGLAPATTFKSSPLKPTAPAIEVIHILLVEDNLVNQQVLRRQLIQQGCVVTVANHGIEALEGLKYMNCWNPPLVDAKRLDFILMDWEMPVMDGLTCSMEIRKLEKEGRVKGRNGRVDIIAITANTRKEQIDTAIGAGIDEVLPKPFIVRELMARLRERLAMRRGLEEHALEDPPSNK